MDQRRAKSADLMVPDGIIHERYSKGVIALQIHGLRNYREGDSAHVVLIDSGKFVRSISSV